MLKLHIELKQDGSTAPRYMPHTELIENLSSVSFNAITAKCAVDGWDIHSWSVSEQLAYDEGYAAAMAGQDSDANPYAEHYWKHNEWWLGWSSHQEANS